jgi:hypothetical protein
VVGGFLTKTIREEAVTMAKVKANRPDDTKKPLRPGMTLESRENQMIALAVDLAEKQLMEGTASSQVITHYLKLGSTMQRLERERLEEENKLLRAKTKALQEESESKTIYLEALKAFRTYAGQGESDDEYDEY